MLRGVRCARTPRTRSPRQRAAAGASATIVARRRRPSRDGVRSAHGRPRACGSRRCTHAGRLRPSTPGRADVGQRRRDHRSGTGGADSATDGAALRAEPSMARRRSRRSLPATTRAGVAVADRGRGVARRSIPTPRAPHRERLAPQDGKRWPWVTRLRVLRRSLPPAVGAHARQQLRDPPLHPVIGGSARAQGRSTDLSAGCSRARSGRPDAQGDLTISSTPAPTVTSVEVTCRVGVDELGELDELLGVRERVVDDQQAAGAQHAHQVGPVAGVVRALGVEEDQVEGAVGEAAQRLGGVLRAQLDEVVDAGLGEVVLRPGRCARPRSRARGRCRRRPRRRRRARSSSSRWRCRSRARAWRPSRGRARRAARRSRARRCAGAAAGPRAARRARGRGRRARRGRPGGWRPSRPTPRRVGRSRRRSRSRSTAGQDVRELLGGARAGDRRDDAGLGQQPGDRDRGDRRRRARRRPRPARPARARRARRGTPDALLGARAVAVGGPSRYLPVRKPLASA